MSKAPAFQFYPADWQKDLNLQVCSLSARGLWIELMCIMHQSQKYGYLIINSESPRDEVLSKLTRTPLKLFRSALKELIENKVARIDENGVIFSKRMVEDQRLRDIRKACGSLGGNPILVNQYDKPPVNPLPTPSSSSSSSSSSSKSFKQKIADEPKNPVHRLFRYFSDCCMAIKGFRPKFNGKIEGALLKSMLKEHSEEQIKTLIDFFLGDRSSDDLSPSLGTCLSGSIVNKWKNRMKGKQETFLEWAKKQEEKA